MPVALRTSLGTVGKEEIGRWLANAPQVSSIDLPSKGIDDEAAALLATLVLNCGELLRGLALKKNSISNVGAKSLADALALLPSGSLALLDLSSNRLTVSGAEALTKAFVGVDPHLGGQSTRLTRLLDLSWNDLGDVGVECVSDCIGSCSDAAGMLRLRLRGVGCRDKGLTALTKCIKSLAELDVSANLITASGAAALCHAAEEAPNLSTLGVSSLASLDRQGREDVASALVWGAWRAPGLRQLDCSGNWLGDEWCAELVGALFESNTSVLEALCLGESGVADTTMAALALGLARQGGCMGDGTGIRVLDLAGNALNDACVAALSRGLARSVALEQLGLAWNRITCVGACALAEGLVLQRPWEAWMESGCKAGIGTGLVDLDLGWNNIADKGAEALAMAAMECVSDARAREFKVPWCLERLNLAGAHVSARVLGLLEAAVGARAAMADAVANELSQESESPATAAALRVLRARRAGAPAGLQVLGLRLSDGTAATMQSAAHSRLQAIWENREAAEVDECKEVPVDEDECNESMAAPHSPVPHMDSILPESGGEETEECHPDRSAGTVWVAEAATRHQQGPRSPLLIQDEELVDPHNLSFAQKQELFRARLFRGPRQPSPPQSFDWPESVPADAWPCVPPRAASPDGQEHMEDAGVFDGASGQACDAPSQEASDDIDEEELRPARKVPVGAWSYAVAPR